MTGQRGIKNVVADTHRRFALDLRDFTEMEIFPKLSHISISSIAINHSTVSLLHVSPPGYLIIPPSIKKE